MKRSLQVEASAANARRFSPSGQRLRIQDSKGLKQDVTSNEVRPVLVLSDASRYHSRSCWRTVFSFLPSSSAQKTETVVNPLDWVITIPKVHIASTTA
ncbi:hypothetical protein VB735_27465 [Halotia wernerae UHCC 0503]|nr:hypothetical protein [Halotia wernerae UHCC 0503]